jgi:hypothetical protein
MREGWRKKRHLGSTSRERCTVGFKDGITDFGLAMFFPHEWQRRNAERRAAEAAASVRSSSDGERPKETPKDAGFDEAMLRRLIVRAFKREKVRRAEVRAKGAAEVQRGRDVQYVDEGCRVEVRSGYDSDHMTIATDIVVYDRTRSDAGHVHMVIAEDGRVLVEHWKTNK